MSGEWRPAPGDVAVVRNEWNVWNVAICAVRPGGFVWVYGVSDSTAPLTADARPLVVIDPEDREQVERLASALTAAVPAARVERIGEVLRSLLTPPPEVLEHFAVHANPHGSPVKAYCGKIWRPDPAAKVIGRCEPCSAVVDAGWVA